MVGKQGFLHYKKLKPFGRHNFPHIIPPYFPTFITFETVIIFKTKHPWQRRNQLQN